MKDVHGRTHVLRDDEQPDHGDLVDGDTWFFDPDVGEYVAGDTTDGHVVALDGEVEA